MGDMVPNSIPRGGMGGFSGNPSAQRPEKTWDTGPQGREEDNPPVPKTLKIPGGGARPF